MNTRDKQFLTFTQSLQSVSADQVAAVADAVGCSEWVGYCNRDGECYCATAARRVAEIERSRS